MKSIYSATSASNLLSAFHANGIANSNSANHKRATIKSTFLKVFSIFFFVSGLFAAINANAQVSVSGGSGLASSYTSLNTAFTAINGTSQSGQAITLTITANITEPGAATLTAAAGAATSILITSNGNYVDSASVSSASLIVLSGANANHVTINGTYSSGTLRFSNGSATAGAAAIELLNGANTNTIENCTIAGLNTNAGSTSLGAGTVYGVVAFVANTANVNSNTIQNCTITPAGSSAYPATMIGANSTYSFVCSSNQILNNTMHDFHLSSGLCTGIMVSGNSTNSDYGDNWTISGNSIYNTVNNNVSDASQVGIYFVPGQTGATSAGHTISNNTIGGNQPVTGGSAPLGTWLTAANNTGTGFQGILVEAKSATITGNYIGNICTLYEVGAGPFFAGINNPVTASGGTIYIAYNVIGNRYNPGGNYYSLSTSTISTFTAGTSTSLTVNSGLSYIVGDTVIVTSQTDALSAEFAEYVIGNVTAYSGTTLTFTIRRSIQNTSESAWYVNNQNSIITSGQYPMAGIWTSQGGNVLNTKIDSNVVANLTGTNQNGTGTVGIDATNGQYTIQGDSVYNLVGSCVLNAAQSTTGAYGVVTGISQQGIVSGVQTVSNNRIFNLYSVQTSTSVNSIVGIDIQGITSTSYRHIADGNLVYNLSLPNAATGANIYGIYMRSGIWRISNSMIRLGLRGDGTTITASNATAPTTSIQSGFAGIYNTCTGSTSTSAFPQQFYFNSVALVGTGVTTGLSYCLARSNTNGSPKDFMDVRDNIFYNNRSGGTANYCVYYESNGDLGPSGSASQEDYNDFYGTGTGFTLAYCGAADASISALQSSASNTGFDTHSIFSSQSNPQFQGVTSTTAVLDISTTVPTPVAGTGSSLSAPTVDFHGTSRSGILDIGADVNSSLIGQIIISYTNIPAQNSLTGPTLGSVTITPPGSYTASSYYIYYKNSADPNNTFNDNTSGTNGWKYAVGSGSGPSSYTFTISYSNLSTSYPAALGSSIQYFVVALDNNSTPDVGINSGSFTALPSSLPLTSAAFPLSGTINTYTIYPGSGTVTVGTGGNYTSLTNSGGLFQALSSTTLTGALTVNILSSLTPYTEGGTGETGTYTLGAISGSSTTNTITIQPNAASLDTIAGNGVATVTPMIYFNGANNVIINGNYSGSGQYLLFENTNATAGNTGPVIQFNSTAAGDTLRNCEIRSNATTAAYGAVTIGATGTNNVYMSGNNIHDAVAANGVTAGTVATGIYSNNANNTVNIQNNNIYNFTAYGLNLTAIANSAKIQGNSFYYPIGTATAAQISIYIIGSSYGHTISGNYIGGQAGTTGASGTPWLNSFAGASYGMYMTLGTTTVNRIYGNIIRNFTFSGSSSSFYGIYGTAGLYDIGGGGLGGNMIGDTATSSIRPIQDTYLGTSSLYGIYITSAVAGDSISNNYVENLNAAETTGAYLNTVEGIYANLTTVTGASYITNDTIRQVSLIGTGASVFYGINLPSTCTQNLIVTGNEVGNLASATSIQNKGSGVTYGIYAYTTASGNRVDSNTVAGFTNTSTSAFTGIYHYAGASSASAVNSNIIQNLTFSSSATAYSFYGIEIGAGLVYVGTTNDGNYNPAGNIIGTNGSPTSIQFAGTTQSYGIYAGVTSALTTGSIISNDTIAGFTFSSTAPFYGIYFNGATTYTTLGEIGNNWIQNMSFTGVVASPSFAGIYVAAGYVNVGVKRSSTSPTTSAPYGNTIGDPNGVKTISFSSASMAQPIYGIQFVTASTSACQLSNNTVAYLKTTNTSSTSSMYGIQIGAATASTTEVQNNTVENLTLAGTGAGAMYGIISNGTGNLNIGEWTGNTIGGNTTGGSPSLSNAGTGSTEGIYVSGASTYTYKINNNTIKGITTATGTGNIVAGIYLTNTSATAADSIYSNAIDSITVNAAATTPTFDGIYFQLSASPAAASVISNNNIYAITVNGTGASNFYGINGVQGSANITGNTIGNGVANNLAFYGTATYSTLANMYGILLPPSSTTTVKVLNNTVQNMTAFGTGTGVELRGIYESNASLTVTSDSVSGNTVANLKTASTLTTGSQGAIMGLYISSSSAVGNSSSLTVTGNQIYSLTDSTTGAAVTLQGIIIAGGDTALGNVVGQNLIHDFTTNDAGATQMGIYVSQCAATYQNNMIRLGLNAAGSAITAATIIQGIYDADGATTSVTDYNNFYFNTVYIGGTGVTNAADTTAAFQKTTASGHCNIRDNIFMNARSNTSGVTGAHYAYYFKGVALAGDSSDANVYYAPGTNGGTLAFNGATGNITTLRPGLQTATGQDLRSANNDPDLLGGGGGPDGAGTWGSGGSGAGSYNNLSLNCTGANGSVAYQAAYSYPGMSVSNDYFGNTRPSPTNIGGDGTNAWVVVGCTQNDVYPPVITYTVIPNQLTTSNVTLSSVNITDQGTGVSQSANLPILYYRKSNGTATIWASATGSYTSGTINNSLWSFTVNYANLYISTPGDYTPGSGDMIQYYVVAQDQAATPNVGASPTAGFAATSVTSIATIPTTPNSYTIDFLTGTVTVGTSGQFTSLTNPGGLFQFINGASITGNVVAVINSNITETGDTTLTTWNDAGAGYTLTIVPDSGNHTLRTLSGTAVATSAAMIPINITSPAGTSRQIIINGTSAANGGPYLSFVNTNATPANTGPVIKIGGSTGSSGLANGSMITNCDIQSNSTTAASGAITLGAGTDTLTISNCNIHAAASGTTGPCATGIYASNSGSVLTITNNNFYMGSTAFSASAVQSGIYLASVGSGNLVNGNYIGGQAIVNGGSAWPNSSTSAFYGIYMSAGTNFASAITNNTIGNLSFTGSLSTSGFNGIEVVAGYVNVGVGINGVTAGENIIGYSTGTIAMASTSSGLYTGIYYANGSTNGGQVSNNRISYFTTPISGAGTSSFYGIYLGSLDNASSTTTIQTDTITNITLSNTGAYSVYGIYQGSGTAGSLTIGGATRALGNVITTITATPATGTLGNTIGINITPTTGLAVYNINNNIIGNGTAGNITTTNATAGVVGGIYVSNTGASFASPSQHNFNNNSISGITVGAVGSTATTFDGIYVNLNVLDTTVSVIQHDTINTILLNGTSTSAFNGINVANGLYDIGGASAGNVIGSTSSRTSIKNRGTGATNGIVLSTGATAAKTLASSIYGNTIAGVTDSLTSAFTGISCAVTTNNYTTASEIVNNNIQYITNYFTSGTFTGIGVTAGRVNVGVRYDGATAGRNVIGDPANLLPIVDSITVNTGAITGISYTTASTIAPLIWNNTIAYVRSSPTTASTSTSTFYGINLGATGAVEPSVTLQNDTIENITLSGTSTGAFYGIYTATTTQGVTIGGSSGTGCYIGGTTNNVSIYNWGTGPTSGIYIVPATAAAYTYNISYNTVQGITTACTGTATTGANGIYLSNTSATLGTINYNRIVNILVSGVVAGLNGIYANLSSGANQIEGDSLYGLSVTGNSTSTFAGIQVAGTTTCTVGASGARNFVGCVGNNSSTYNGTSTAYGIYNASAGLVNINYNVVNDISATNTASAGATLYGIYSTSTVASQSISNNRVDSLTLNSTYNTATTTTVNAAGIITSTFGTTSKIAMDTVYAIQLTNTGAYGPNVAGIAMLNSTASTNDTIRQCDIYNITNAATGTTVNPTANGIYIYNTGTTATTENLSNNMIMLGVGQTNNITYNGIWLNSAAAEAQTDNLYFNTVDIEGSPGTNTDSSYAFLRSAASTTTSTITMKNNIFSNIRGGGTGKHYAIASNGTGYLTNWTGANMNYNVLYSANSATLGQWNSVAKTFSGWQAAQTAGSGGDANSINVQPSFVTNYNSFSPYYSNTGILDLGPANCSIKGQALTGTGFTFDFHNNTRSGLFPTIGADESLIGSGGAVAAGTYNIDGSQSNSWQQSVTAAFNYLYCNGISGNVILSLDASTYTQATETFPINIKSIPGTGSPNYYTVTLTSSYSGGSTVSNTATTTLFNFDNTGYVIFDGTVGGQSLTLTNSNTANTAPVIEFQNDASYNTIQNLTISAGNTTAAGVGSGLIYFGAALSIGNQNDTIRNCNMGPTGTTPVTPLIIYSNTATNTAALINNNIFNWTAFGVDFANVAAGCTISDNSFYYNLNSAVATTSQTAISLLGSTGNHSITGNFIGGQSASAGGGGWSNSFAGVFTGITATVSTTVASEIYGNTVTNIILSGGASTGFTGISATGLANIGYTKASAPATGNTIGGTSAITLMTGASSASITGISVSDASTVNSYIGNNTVSNIGAPSNSISPFVGITATLTGTVNSTTTSFENNTVSGITITGTTSTNTFTGINVASSSTNIIKMGEDTGNVVGSTSITNSIESAATGAAIGISVTTTSNSNQVGSVTTGNTVSGFTTTGAGPFTGILLSAGTGTATSVQGNTVNDISVNSTGASSFKGISLTAGAFNTGTLAGNTIGGSSSASPSDVITYAGTSTAYGIYSTASGVDSIGARGATPGNTVMGITATNAGSSVQVVGITHNAAFTATIANNTVKDLAVANTSAANVGTGASASVVGIALTSTATTGLAVSQNTVDSLYNTNSSSTAVNVVGIFYSGGTSGTQLVSRNFVHSFSTASTGAVQQGINITLGTNASIQNNMVQLGIDGSGASVITSAAIYGIYKAAAVSNSYYFNSVYIGGTGVTGGAVNTAAFFRSATGADTVKNNIFDNVRSYSSGAGLNYAYVINAATTIFSDYNIFNASGTNGAIATTTGVGTNLTLQGLRFALGGLVSDLHSGVGDPDFVTPAGTASTTSLKVQSPTPAYHTGLAISAPSITVDNGGYTRNNPPDIGADESGTYTQTDIFTPLITSVSASPSTGLALCGGDAITTVTATIIDNGAGVDQTTGSTGTGPELWYRNNSSASNAWSKVQYTSVASNVYTWNLNVPATASTTYQYYIVAQDLAATPNVWYSQFSATVPNQTVDTAQIGSSYATAPFTNTFATGSIVPLSGSVHVRPAGSSGAYKSLSGASGVFAAINTNGLGGNLYVYIDSSESNETGANALTGPTTLSCGTTSDTVFIYPADNSFVRTVSGNSSGGTSQGLDNPLITFSEAKNVVINGWYNNTSSSTYNLKFINRYANYNDPAPAVAFVNNTTYCTLENAQFEAYNVDGYGSCIIWLGQSTTATGSSGNSHITINNNIIGDNGTDTTGTFAVEGILSTGGTTTSSSVCPNDSNTITNNQIINFCFYSTSAGEVGSPAWGILLDNTGDNSNYGDETNGDANNGGGWTITGNSFYFTSGPIASSTGGTVAISFGGGSSTSGYTGSGNIISNNYFGGQAASAGGSAMTMTQLESGDGFTGIYYTGYGATISGNIFKNITLSRPMTCIEPASASGTIIVDNNIIGNATTPISGSTSATTDAFYGIEATSSGSHLQIDSNIIQDLNITTGYLHGIQYDALAYAGSVSYNYFDYNRVAGGFNDAGTGQAGVYQLSADIVVDADAGSAGAGTGTVISFNKLQIPEVTSTTYYAAGIAIEQADASGILGGTVNGNVISDTTSQSAASEFGIYLDDWYYAVNWTISNNQIELANIRAASTTSAGIADLEEYFTSGSGGLNKFLYNTIYIKGTGGTSTSYAFEMYPELGTGNEGMPLVLENNILINARTSTGISYAIGSLGTTSVWTATGSASNYNFFVANNSSSYIGYQHGTNETFTNWKASITNIDLNSVSTTYNASSSSYSSQLDPENLFISTNPPNLNINTSDGQSYQFVYLKATPVSVVTDINLHSRNTSTPDIGSDEFCFGSGSPPVTTAATSLLSTSFVANWNAVDSATTYYLNVSTSSNFSSYLAGYQNLNVGNVTTYTVTGTSGTGTYYYTISASGTGTPCLYGVLSNIDSASYCTASASITSHTNVGCYGASTGAATVTATGSSPFSYLWTSGGATSSSVSGLTAGSYTVTVTATGGCSTTATATITQPSAALAANASATSTSCYGTSDGSVLSAPSGGTSPYSYSWSPGGATSSSVTGLSYTGTTYTVTVTDANTCTATGTATVGQPSAVSAPSVSDVDNCGSSTLTASGYTGTLSWSTGATTSSINVTSGGAYTVTQTVGVCTSPAGTGTAAPLVVPATPSVADNDYCGYSILSTTATGTLLWSTGATTTNITVTSGGAYTVTQTASDGCTSTAGSGTAAPSTVPATPSVTDNDYCGYSILSTTATGTLSWSNGATTTSITVTSGGAYTVTSTAGNGCTSTAGSGTASPLSVPSAPVVNDIDNCDGTSLLYTTATGTLSWSTTATTSSITVTAGGTYSVTRTVGSCTSAAGTAVATPGATPSTPSVSVVNNCNGSSTLSTTATGALSWSTTATTSSITVTAAGTYSVTQTIGGCTSAAGTGVASLGSCSVSFTVKFFMQGYYLSGSGTMSPLLNLLNVSGATSTSVDTVTIELHASSGPYSVVDSYKGVLQSNGNLVCTFAGSDAGNAYYIVINHRNSLQTWSANAVTINNSGSYDFSTGGGQAYGSNEVNVGGVYCIYSGDVNQDGSINLSDKYSVESAASSFILGSYNVNDVTGDGIVDEDDVRIIQNNASIGLSVQMP